METLPINLLIKDYPDIVCLLDHNLHIVSYSRKWCEQFGGPKTHPKGESIFKFISNAPKQLALDLQKGINGFVVPPNEGKFIQGDGSIHWYKWKINSWQDAQSNFIGLLLSVEDISELKRNMELFLKTEKVSRTGSWEVNLIDNSLYWSPMTKKIHEVGTEYRPSLAESINFYKEGDHRNKIKSLFHRAVTQGKPYDTHLIVVTAKGNELWVRTKGEAEFTNGQCVRVFGIFQDINEIKKTELQAKETSELLDMATKAAQIGIWEYDVDENTIKGNDLIHELFNVPNTPQHLVDDWINKIVPEDQHHFTEQLNLSIAEGKPFHCLFKKFDIGGELRHFIAVGEAKRNKQNKVGKVIGALWDITEISRTKLQLERTEESFKESFEKSAIGMALVGLDGQWINVNQAICTSLGYTKNELLKLTFQDITYPKDLNIDLHLLKEVLEGKRDSYQMVKRYFHKSGHMVHAILTVTVARNIHGEIAHFISQIVDISTRVNAEKELKTLLNVTKEQNESLMNFAHIVSHNLRSHSTNLTMLTKFLMTENDPEERYNLLGMLRDASESLSETVQHLNEVVRIKTGGVTEKMKKINLYDTIKRVEQSIKSLLKEKGVKTNITVDRAHGVKAVPAYMESILLNLYTNAIKYSNPDQAPVITITSTLYDKQILITFADNGQGIDLERHGNKIFGMYKTFHTHKDAKGIGLFITKNQIESMQGSIWIKSIVGEGTTFFISLKRS